MNKLFKWLTAVTVVIASCFSLSLSMFAEIETTDKDDYTLYKFSGKDFYQTKLENLLYNHPFKGVYYWGNENLIGKQGYAYYSDGIYPVEIAITDVEWIDNNDHSKGSKCFYITISGANHCHGTNYTDTLLFYRYKGSFDKKIMVKNPDLSNEANTIPMFINWDIVQDNYGLLEGDILVYADENNTTLNVTTKNGEFSIHGGLGADRNRKLCSNCGTSSEDNPDLQFIKQGDETYCLPCYQSLFGAEFEFNPDDLMNDFDYNFKGIPDINDYAMDFNTGFDWLDTLLGSLSQMLLFPFYIVNYLLATLTNIVAVLTNIIALFSSFLTGDLVNAMQLWFKFIPSEIWTIIALGLSIIVLLRVVGR